MDWFANIELKVCMSTKFTRRCDITGAKSNIRLGIVDAFQSFQYYFFFLKMMKLLKLTVLISVRLIKDKQAENITALAKSLEKYRKVKVNENHINGRPIEFVFILDYGMLTDIP